MLFIAKIPVVSLQRSKKSFTDLSLLIEKTEFTVASIVKPRRIMKTKKIAMTLKKS